MLVDGKREKMMEILVVLIVAMSSMLLGGAAAAEEAEAVVAAKRKVLVEYIGAEGFPVDFEQAPITPDVDYYFVLSFAVDADADGKNQNGIFRKVWADNIDSASVAALKSKHKNVRVLMSLGGWSVYTKAGKDKVLFWYIPEDKDAWLKNAYSSIGKLVKEYSLDGIDIDYESFHSGDTQFGSVVGELITKLKNDSVISIATIAPFQNIEAQYKQLYEGYKSVIDLVNYQFYTSEKVPKIEEFMNIYREKSRYYGVEKTLVSMQIYGPGLQGEAFFNATKLALNETQNVMPGVMIYSYDLGIRFKTNFYHEKEIQSILAASSQ